MYDYTTELQAPAEDKRVSRGLALSLIGMVLAIIPVFGIALSINGLYKTISAVAENKGRQRVMIIFSILFFIVSAAVSCAVAYLLYINRASIIELIQGLLASIGVGGGQSSPPAENYYDANGFG